jgi:hypothetical protein
LSLVLVACGAGAGTSGPNNPSGARKTDDSIADIASREGIVTFGGGAGTSSGVAAGGAPGTLRMELVDKDSPIRFDGIPKEWPSHVPAKTVIKGPAGSLAFSCGIQYDADHVYVMGEVTDGSLKVGSDHASLVIAFPNGSASEIDFYPGKPGESVGSVKMHGAEIAHSKIVEAPASNGYSFEASFPWTVLPDARNVRVGLRGVCRYHDASGTILATGSGDASSPAQLPVLPTSPELALYEGLLGPRGYGVPKVELYADIAGDAQKERVAVYGRTLTVVGAGYRGGKEYFYRDLGAELVKIEARDLTGSGKDNLILRRRWESGGSQREWVDVWAFKTDEPEPIFTHELSIMKGANRITNAMRLAQKEIEVTYEKPEGWDASNYREPTTSDFEPVLLPWGAVKSQTYKWDGTRFAKFKEVPQTPTAPAPPALPPQIKPIEPAPAAVAKNMSVQAATFEQFKRDMHVSPDTKPKVDLEANVDGDAKNERVILIGRDIVVFGPGFKGGTTYAYVTLSQFADADDIKEMQVRDLTGDGLADMVVRGVRKVQNGGQTVAADVMFVYSMQNGALTRVFGIETARELQGKRVQGTVQFVPAKSGKGFDILAAPGRAIGWTEKDFPWAQEQPGSGSIEPLLLPWGKIPSVRYAWSGTSFAKAP